jgi:hypothetical protein
MDAGAEGAKRAAASGINIERCGTRHCGTQS